MQYRCLELVLNFEAFWSAGGEIGCVSYTQDNFNLLSIID